MILIKLGGSVITDKMRYMTFNRSLVSRLCEEIGRSGRDVVVVHGAGSFGHVVAKEHRLQDGFVDGSQIPGVARVSSDVRRLNCKVMRELVDAGIPAVSVPPGSCFQLDGGELVGDTEILERYVGMGMVPVMFGDVVLDRDRRFGICSGDRIMEFLADLFSPEMAIFVSDVDGLFDDNPKRNRNAKLIETVTHDTLERVRSRTDAADVTGGVMEKMRAMLRMCAPGRDCLLVNGKAEGRLYDALTGKDVIGTRASGGPI